MLSSPFARAPGQARLVLVVGPSGAGKDALLDRARIAFRDDPRIVFARRIVTRTSASAEDHDTMDEADFVRAERERAFLLSWRAHGLCYGLPASLRDDLTAGRTIVANVSRGVIALAEALGHPVRILHVTADPATLAARIAGRGRENAADIASRLARAPGLHSASTPIIEIRNDGSLEHGASLFIEALRRCTAATDGHD